MTEPAPSAVEPASFEPAARPVIRPSDAPRRETGSHTRSGNAMLRTRVAILDAAAHCVERYGVRKTTMGDVALKAGVAKATLYNHFRTKDDLLAALLESRLAELAATCEAVAAGRPSSPQVSDLARPDHATGLAGALLCAAAALAVNRPLRRVVADEPAMAARFAVPGPERAWVAARAAVADVLIAAGAAAPQAAVDTVLRWLAGQVLWPATGDQAVFEAELLARGLGRPV